MILRHARACLRNAARRPLALVVVLFAVCAMAPCLWVLSAMPQFVHFLVFAATGILAEMIVVAVLAPIHRRTMNEEYRGPAMPTLPLSRRARALGEALAAAPILALAGALTTLVLSHVPPVDVIPFGGLLSEFAPLALVVPLIVLPAVIGYSLQAGRGVPAQFFAWSLPGAAVWLAWKAGLLESPLALPAVSFAVGTLLLALGPLPRLSWPIGVPFTPLWSLPPARSFGHGLLRAHLRASPMVLVALAPWALTGFSSQWPETYVGVGVCAVALAAAFRPYGRTALATGAGSLSPWATLPLDRHRLARRLYAHVLVSLLGLPTVYALLLVALGRVDGFDAPILATIGLTMAPLIAAASLSWWLGGWPHLALTGLAAGLLFLSWDAVTAVSPGLLVALAVGSVVAGLAPVADLLWPWRLAPKGARPS